MSESDGDCASDEYIFYRDRPDWKDVSGISQDDGPYSVVKIAYTESFQDVYDYFRAVVSKGELSERALLLTEDAIQMNAANYTVWQYRRKIIKHISYDLNKELEFCREMIEVNPKNYQVWHHRRVIVEWLGNPSKELRLTRIIFSSDAKNYHAWEHRQWVLSTFNLFEGELDYVEELIDQDIRNNSAWNQRYFVISRTTGFTEDVIQREISFAQKAIEKLVSNESPWNYLKGFITLSQKRLSDQESVINWCWDLHRVKGHNSPFLLTFLIDALEDKMEASLADREKFLGQALQLCHLLLNEHDKIRREYWKHTSRRLDSKFGN